MSLFLGDSTTGDNIIHLTGSPTTLTQMKSDTPISNTVFHSKATYNEVTNVTILDIASVPSYSGYLHITWNFPTNIQTMMSAASSTWMIFIEDSYGNMHTEAEVSQDVYTLSNFSPENRTSYTNYTIVVRTSSAAHTKYSTAKLHILEVDSFSFTNGPIYVGNNDILINNESVANRVYLSMAAVNSYNTKYTTASTDIQLIDASNATSIGLDSTGITQLIDGTHYSMIPITGGLQLTSIPSYNVSAATSVNSVTFPTNGHTLFHVRCNIDSCPSNNCTTWRVWNNKFSIIVDINSYGQYFLGLVDSSGRYVLYAAVYYHSNILEFRFNVSGYLPSGPIPWPGQPGHMLRFTDVKITPLL